MRAAIRRVARASRRFVVDSGRPIAIRDLGELHLLDVAGDEQRTVLGADAGENL